MSKIYEIYNGFNGTCDDKQVLFIKYNIIKVHFGTFKIKYILLKFQNILK